MAMTDRLDRFQRRHPGAGFPIAVLYKFFDDQGNYLAALIAYYGFVSLFPLLLLLSTVLGFVLRGNPHLQQSVLHSALHQFPVIGQQLGEPRRIGGGTGGLVIGILGSVYGGLGVAQALQNAMNTAWAIPRNSRPNPIKARLRSLILLGVVGLAVAGTTVLSALGTRGWGIQLLFIVASVAVNAGVFILAFRVATAHALSLADVVPGALGAAVIWQVLQSVGSVYIGHVVKSASATNGVFALVLGLLAFLYLAAMGVVISVEVNVVRARHLHPRALLTPFTDNVDLTAGDKGVYAGAAKAQRTKGFEEVDVRFNPEQQSDGEPEGAANDSG